MDQTVDLDVIGALEGSDKSSSSRFAWDYLRHYEALFAPFRDRAFNLLEIGIGQGPSLRMWHWFFPHAEITGIDINPACLRYAGPRVTVAIGSQIDPAFLDAVCERAPPEIILDDGSHVYEHMIFSFEHLFPKLAPGGIYVVEDISIHNGPKAARPQPSVPEYFLDVARRCFARGQVPRVHALPDFIDTQVDRVTFLGHAVAIHKRHRARDISQSMATAEAYLTATPRPAEMHLHYAEWLLTHDGPPARAAEAVRQAQQGGITHAGARLLEAEAKRRMGDQAGAAAIAAEITAQRVGQHHVLYALAELQMRLGERAAAMATRDQATAAAPLGRELHRKFEVLLR
jgi:trans-aconitate methyltransferase